jgi:sugar phosphate permease
VKINTRPEDKTKFYHRYRWRIWIVASLAHTIGMFHRAAMAPMADRIMADFEISAAVFGSISAVYFYTYAAMQLPSGLMADTLGPRKTITFGLLAAGVGTIVMSQAATFGLLYFGRFLLSAGVSVVFLSLIKIIMEWFKRQEVATVTGLAVSVTHVGQLVATVPLSLLVMSVGWRMSLMTASFVTFGLAAASWFVIRNSPAQLGLPPVEDSVEEDIGQNDGVMAALSGAASRLKRVALNPQIWPLFFIGFGTYGAYVTLVNNWGVVYIMQTYGVPRDFAATFFLIATIGIMVGYPMTGLFADRIFKSRRLPALMFTGIALTSFLIWSLWNGGKPPLGALYPLAFVLGFGTSGALLAFACVRDTIHPSIRGTASGLVNMGMFVGAAVAQPLFGYLLDLGWQGHLIAGTRVYPLEAFQNGLYLCSAFAAIGFFSAIRIKKSPQNSHCVITDNNLTTNRKK